MTIRTVRLVRFTLSLLSDCWAGGLQVLYFLIFSCAAICVLVGLSLIAGWAAALNGLKVHVDGATNGQELIALGVPCLFGAVLLSVAIYGAQAFVLYVHDKWAALR